MDFEHSAEQVALADLVRAIVTGRFGLDRLRRHEGTPNVVDPDDWAALGEAGVFSLTVPEGDGGVGLGLADAAIVFGELGRGLVPGPLVASHLAASLAGVAELAGAAEGTTVVGSLRRPGPRDGDRPLVLVEHLESLDARVVVEPAGLVVVDPGTVDALDAARPLDPLTPMARVAQLAPGERVTGAEGAARWVRDERILTGALCAGIAAATCDLAVDDAKGRHQFGRPIGSFQAVKHLCADMLVRAEVARAAVEAAAVTVDQPEVGDALRAAAGAALLAAEAAVANAKACIQVHGGMGFTWEVPVHLYLMRARVLASTAGTSPELAAEVAARY